MDYLDRASVLVKLLILRLIILFFYICNNASLFDGGGRLNSEVKCEIRAFELSLHRYVLLKSPSFLKHSPPEIMLIVTPNFLNLILANADEIGTDFPDETHEDSFAACTDPENVLMRLLILAQLKISGITGVCLYDPQIIPVKVCKFSDDFEAGEFLRERAAIERRKDKHKHASVIVHNLYSDSEMLLISVLLFINYFMLFELLY